MPSSTFKNKNTSYPSCVAHDSFSSLNTFVKNEMKKINMEPVSARRSNKLKELEQYIATATSQLIKEWDSVNHAEGEQQEYMRLLASTVKLSTVNSSRYKGTFIQPATNETPQNAQPEINEAAETSVVEPRSEQQRQCFIS